MAKKFIRVAGNTIYFFTGVKHKTIAALLEEVHKIAYASKNKKKEVKIVLCSMGGNCEAAFAFHDLMRSLYKDIVLTVVATGEVASSSVYLLLAAPLENRFITENGNIFLHEVEYNDETGVTMNDRDFKNLLSDEQELIIKNQKTAVRIIAQRTNLKKKKILKLMRNKTLLNAKEIVEYGFVGGIVPSV